MKVNFVKAIPFVPEWNGNRELPPADQVSMVLTPLEAGEAMHIMAVMTQEGVKAGDESSKLPMKAAQGIVEAAGRYVPLHVQDLKGADDFTLEDVLKYFHFYHFAAEILFKLIEISQPTEADVKNSKPQPA